MPPRAKRAKRRVVVDTSVVVAGIAGFREPYEKGRNPSADLLFHWADTDSFVWLYSEETLAEYKAVLKRMRVRPHIIGAFVNLLRERAEMVEVRSNSTLSPDPGDDPICHCSEDGGADYLVTLNIKDFPQDRLRAVVVRPDEFI